jgi:hypothetical protein
MQIANDFGKVRAALNALLTEGIDFSIYVLTTGIESRFPPAVIKENPRGYLRLFLGPVTGIGLWATEDDHLIIETAFHGKKQTLEIPYANVSSIMMPGASLELVKKATGVDMKASKSKEVEMKLDGSVRPLPISQPTPPGSTKAAANAEGARLLPWRKREE